MDINRVSSYVSESVSQSDRSKTSKTDRESKKESAVTSESTNTKKEESAAAVVETGSKTASATYSKKSAKVDTATIEKLKKEADERTAQLRSIVEKLLMKQSKTYNSSMDIYDLIKNGNLEVDDETRAQAQKDIVEDGYWGVKQTSDRLFSFATALAGNDPEQADKMIEAFKEGYKAAEKKWGGELPDICKQTYDAFLQKMDDWKNSKTSEADSTQQE